MAQKLGKAGDFSLGRFETAIKVTLEHHAKIVGAPTRHPRAHGLLPLIEVVPGVLDLLAQQLSPQSGIAGTADHPGRDDVVRLAIVAFFGERDCSCFGYIANVRHRNSRITDRHRIDSWPHKSVLQIRVVLNVVAGTQNGIRNTELAQRALDCQLGCKVRHIAELVRP